MKTLLREPCARPLLYRLFCGGFAALSSVCILLTLIYNQTPFIILSRKALLLCIVCGVGGGLAAAWLWGRFVTQNARVLSCAAAAVLLGYFVFLVAFGIHMRISTEWGWDYGVVFEYARSYVDTGALPGEYAAGATYFDLFGNNAALYVMLVWVLRAAKLVGAEPLKAAIVLNCVFIVAAMGLYHALLKKLTGAKNALFGLLCGCMCMGIWAYAPVVYSDTLALPFPVGIALCWLYARDAFAAGHLRRALGLAALCGLLAALGAQLKVTVAILLAALLIDLLLAVRGPVVRRALLAAVLAGAFAIVYLLTNAAVWHSGMLAPRDREAAVPFTHWVMMGLHENGNYYDPDYALTLSAPDYDARVALNRAVIRERLEQMGVQGFVAHLAGKLSFIAGDGTYYAPIKLDRGVLDYNFLHRWLIVGGPYLGMVWHVVTGLHVAMMAFAGLGAARAACGRSRGAEFLAVAVFGLLLFLLLWEARSRYLVHFMPLWLALAVCGLCPAGAAAGHKPASSKTLCG